MTASSPPLHPTDVADSGPPQPIRLVVTLALGLIPGVRLALQAGWMAGVLFAGLWVGFALIVTAAGRISRRAQLLVGLVVVVSWFVWCLSMVV